MALRAHPLGVDQQKIDKVARFTLALSRASLTQLPAFLGPRGPLIEVSVPSVRPLPSCPQPYSFFFSSSFSISSSFSFSFFSSFCPVPPSTLVTPHVTTVVVFVASCRWSFGGTATRKWSSWGAAPCKWSSGTPVTLVTSAKIQIQSSGHFWNNWFLFLPRTNRQTRWFYWLILWQLWQIHGATFTNTCKNFDKCL